MAVLFPACGSRAFTTDEEDGHGLDGFIYGINSSSTSKHISILFIRGFYSLA